MLNNVKRQRSAYTNQKKYPKAERCKVCSSSRKVQFEWLEYETNMKGKTVSEAIPHEPWEEVTLHHWPFMEN